MFGARAVQKYGLVLSLEAGSVSAVLVESDSTKETPAIVYSTKKVLPPKSDVSVLRDTLKGVAMDIEQQGRKVLTLRNSKAHLEHVLALCGSPWASTVPHTIQFEGKTSFTIDAKLLKDLQKAAEEQAALDPAEQVMLETQNFMPVERAIVDTKVNGYDVDEPMGAEGQLLELTEVTSFVSKEITEIVETTCEYLAPGTDIVFATYAFATYWVLRDVHPDVRSFCFVRLSEEVTEIGVVQKDALLGIDHFAYGTETVLRSICEDRSAPQAHIRSQLCMHQEGVMDQTALQEIEKYLGTYMAEISKAFSSLSSKHPIPRQIFILTSTSFDSILTQKIIETLQTVNNQSHVLVGTERLLEDQNGTVLEAVLGRFFHKLHKEGRL